jgi:hypothetical protein
MSLIQYFKTRKTLDNPAKINIHNIKKFIQGTYYNILLNIPFLACIAVSKSRKEQIAWRLKQVEIKSPDCYKHKMCYCGCDVNGLVAANPECEQKNHCFPAMMDAKTWNTYKTKNNI